MKANQFGTSLSTRYLLAHLRSLLHDPWFNLMAMFPMRRRLQLCLNPITLKR